MVQVLPVVLPALERNTRSHWNAAVVSLTANVKKMFQEMDGPLYDHCRLQFERDEVNPFGLLPGVQHLIVCLTFRLSSSM